MSVDTHKETRQFQTEVSQLLHMMINALYSNKEIFLRELISNAADACDKLRFEALSDDALMEGEGELGIQVEYDKDARTVTVRDNGIGMSRDDVINNIGTIAHSGTREFLSRLTGDQKKDAHLIGQFGVGFYSSFIVADRVTLTTRRAGMGAEHGVLWESDGSGEFTVETVEKAGRGTEVVLHLKKDEDEFLDEFRLRHIITRYSDHIPLPIAMRKRDDDGKALDEWETVNRASALWTRSKSDISDEEYKEFYKHVAHDFEEPLTWTHNRVEGRQEYTSLLYIPKRAPFDLWDRDRRHGIKLYVQRVFIMDDAEQLMPTYLRFVRGVVDSNDLPLNISREILQNNRLIDGIRSGSVKKVLGLLEDLAKKDPEEYQTFWDAFGRVLKEGPAEDYANREQIGRLLRFASTHTGEASQNVSLADYIGRMKEGQDTIYYITADSHTAALHSPHLEVFRKRGIEVLLLSDRVDEWLVSHLHEFEGKSLKSVAKGDLDLGDTETEEEKKAQQEAEEQVKDLLPRIQEALGERVKEVKFSHRLTDSPACIVLSEDEMALYMQQLLKQAGQNLPDTKPVLEVNPTHRLIQRMGEETDEARFKDWSSLLLDQAVLAEGGQLEDPAGFVKRLNTLITHG
ncbi:molecular chaperone HtpG [Ectothiorhodospira variabilis]|uniref:molecular chaperone HtpG n=1 Tax=Ectothiorhodospira variabilis TaxID=505694 RepID=UPI001EFBE208|nr:molecular chaperone HtpG [Ectothiorhodospira variabilis]MCG5495830.1 molecular chaperone HtpG [Ectothiorhodospira variabilis]MCG5504736.1 molecular chaperone HtpG [Ectothiorhodospira variabilis]MCG5507893.1 molecular chaperone HtpG [Ectothiorhodospira variabilis]